MEFSNLYFKTNLSDEKYDKTECLSSNLFDDSLIIKGEDLFDKELNNIFTDNKFLETNNEINEENENKIINNNSKKVDFDNTNKAIDKSKKVELQLKRNRESARKGRLRKKEYIQNLIKENNYLKNKYKLILNIIHNCPKCKEEFLSKINNNIRIDENEKEIFNGKSDMFMVTKEPKINNKKKFLFLTAITIISLINLCNIPLIIINNNKSNDKNNEYFRNLKSIKEQNILINKLSTNNGDNEALMIHFSEFYSLTKREKVENIKDVKKIANENIRIFHENQINIDQINRDNVGECIKCMVELDKKSIKLGGDEFTFYLANRHLTKFFSNNTEDGIFPQINFDENSRKYESFSKFLALRCKILAYSISDIYSEKL